MLQTWPLLVSIQQSLICPQGYKLFSCSTQLKMKFSLLINMKMPTNIGIFIFISLENSTAKLSKKTAELVSNLLFVSRETFMLSWVEHEKGSITLGPGSAVFTQTLMSQYLDFLRLYSSTPNLVNTFCLFTHKHYHRPWWGCTCQYFKPITRWITRERRRSHWFHILYICWWDDP